MPHHKSAKKRVKTNEIARVRNRGYRTLMRNAIKKLQGISEKEAAIQQYRSVSSILDRLVLKGIIHRNQAARKKSKLARLVNALS